MYSLIKSECAKQISFYLLLEHKQKVNQLLSKSKPIIRQSMKLWINGDFVVVVLEFFFYNHEDYIKKKNMLFCFVA